MGEGPSLSPTTRSKVGIVAQKRERDPWLEHAKENIFSDYGVRVSVENKNKDLLKFGRSQEVTTSKTTLMLLPAGIRHETLQTSNSITTVVSSNAADTQQVVIEGHTLDGSDFTFRVQVATLNGQTPVTLGTALARCTRVANIDSTDIVGTVYVTQNDTFTNGVPDTDAKVHMEIRPGEQQSEKAATTISSVDFWIVTSFYCDMLTKASAFAEVALEVKEYGKVFRPKASISCSSSGSGRLEFKPYIIVPPNSDVRLVGVSDAAGGRDVSGGIEGTLLK